MVRVDLGSWRQLTELRSCRRTSEQVPPTSWPRPVIQSFSLVRRSIVEFVEAGGLIAYAVNYPDLYYRFASFADKIFKGAKPGELPVEQPTKFELVINLKTANALGLTIPQSVLLRADEVIR